MESLADFVERLSRAVGCYYHKGERQRYSLKQHNSLIRDKMCVFGWVSNRVTQDRFVVSTYKRWANATAVNHANKVNPKGQFGAQAELVYYVAHGSRGSDYQKAATALQVVGRNKCGPPSRTNIV